MKIFLLKIVLNYLFINNFLVDEKNVRENIKTQDAKSKLTQLVFNPYKDVLNYDKDLPYNIRTLLSTRYVVRADTAVCDDFMKCCLADKKFCTYLQKTDWDYYCQIAKERENIEKSA